MAKHFIRDDARGNRSEKGLCNIKFSTSKNTALLASLLVGLVTLSIGFYLLIMEIIFVQKATRFDATIVEVRHELVQKGKGSVLAYVPVEDETVEGRRRARQNVIHEAGLFQGRLGFKRAIVLRQEGLEDFTNVAGLQYIGFIGGWCLNLKIFSAVLCVSLRSLCLSCL